MTAITPEFIQSQIARGRKHCLVFLKRGPNRNQDEPTANRLQLEHLAHLFGLMTTHHLAVNGPVMGHAEIVGISIYESADREIVEAFVKADPAVAAGRLSYEIFEWFGIDRLGFPASQPDSDQPAP